MPFARIRAHAVKLSRLLRRRREEQEFAEEIAADLQCHIDAHVRAGLAPDDARRVALAQFGGLAAIRETRRDMRALAWLETFLRDVSYGLRLLRRSPGFAAAAVVSLAVGIGANTAIFSIIDALVLRPLPVRDPGALVHITPNLQRTTWTNPLWEQMRDRRLFDGMAAWSAREFDLAGGGVTQFADGALVSGGFFETLGVQPARGRLIQERDDVRGGGDGGAVAVISHAFWQRHFAGAPDIVGRTLSLELVPFRVIGVMQEGFSGPSPGRALDVAVPIASQPLLLRRNRLDDRSWWWLTAMARLAPGQTAQGAEAALAIARPAMREATLPANMRPEDAVSYLAGPIAVRPAPQGPSTVRRQYQHPLTLIMAVVALVLLVACVNVANLLLARAEGRRAEVQLRLALGASRGRLVRQFLVESLVIASIGAVCGLALALWASRLWVSQLATGSGAVRLDISLDWRVLAFTAAVTVAVSFIFGTAPALRAAGAPAAGMLTERVMSRGRLGVGRALVAAQVAICFVLVVTGGLFVRTFTALTTREMGFDADRVLVTEIDARRSARPRQRALTFDRILSSVEALPGVEAAALSVVTPVSENEWDTTIENLPGASLTEAQRHVRQNLVTPAWFKTYGVPLLAGRHFTKADAGPNATAAIVNDVFASTYFPGRSPIGESFRELSGPEEPAVAMTIIGVVRDSVYLTLRDDPMPVFYRPLNPSPVISLSVRAASGSPALLGPSIADAIGRIDRELPLTMRPLAQDIETSIARERLLASLSGSFGVLALLLAAVGLYGVVSYGVGARRREIGIRLALGGQPRAVMALVVRNVAWVVGAGIVAGATLSIWVTRVSGSLLFGIEPGGATTVLWAVAVMLLVGVMAAWIPARRAARINPGDVLRT